MSWLFSLALKNLRRNLRRTLISSIAVVAGVAITIVGTGLVGGLNEGIVRAQIDSQSGHVSIRPPGLEHSSVSNPVDSLVAVPANLMSALEEFEYTERLLFDARVIAGADAVRGLGIGYTASDAKVFLRDAHDLVGVWSEEAPAPGLVLGKGVAALLRLELGDRITVETRTSAGSLNAMSWPLVGIVHAHNPAVDNYAVFLPMEQAQRLVVAPGPSQIALRLAKRGRSDEVAENFRSQLPEGWTVESFTVAAADLMEINKIREKALQLMIFVILAIAAIGIANTVIMSVYERIREELRLGKNSRAAVDAGFSSALTAVLDANITTFIAGVVLYTYGTGPIKGFSVTLMIGIITTLFTGIFVSRTMMDFVTRKTSVRLSI